jgi:hypothetical protein
MKVHTFYLVPGSVEYNETPEHAAHRSGIVAAAPRGVSIKCRMVLEFSEICASPETRNELQKLLVTLAQTNTVKVVAP